jgi:hypothetical protein
MESESGIQSEAAPPISAVLADVDGTLVTKDKVRRSGPAGGPGG